MESLGADNNSLRPMPTAWDKYAEWLLPQWEKLLASDPLEDAVHGFLAANPVLLPGGDGDVGPGGHHGPHLDGVFSKPPLKGLRRDLIPDFMWITRSTSLVTPICIEIERPGKHWFNLDGTPTADYTQAHDQLAQWRTWFAQPENQLVFRTTYGLQRYDHRSLLPQYVLIYGRQSEFDQSTSRHADPGALRQKRHSQLLPDEVFMTFDSLQPRATLSDFVTLAKTATGFELLHVPPSFTSGPSTSQDLLRVVRDPTPAIIGTPLWSDERKAYVVERWRYWRRTNAAPTSPRFRTITNGE